MTELDILRKGFVAFIDGLWWGLRDNTGALSMYEGYSRGFKQMGQELAESIGGKGPEKAAVITGEILNAIGLEVEVNKRDIFIKSCPIWNRILQRGLEFAFHVEEICWMPLLEGIAEKTGSIPIAESSLRLIHIEGAKVDYKKTKAKKAFDKGDITKEEYDKQIVILDKGIESMVKYGHYRFE
ncbi:hypothetical protein EU527_14235 [Candidatus Thorarchaeota archaeon]|nr:MAG: hypothetical protein EU527_14235 [Candidatus Thorarchaeota archaeon]